MRYLRTYLCQTNSFHVDVVDEDESVTGHDSTVQLSDATGHETANHNHGFIGVDRVLNEEKN